MAFLDIKSLKATAKSQKASAGRIIALVGPRRMGKSTTIGTIGLPTLLLTTAQESHGIDSAGIKALPEHLTAIILNVAEGRIVSTAEIDPDYTLDSLIQILSMEGLEKEFKVVAIDSLSAIDEFVSNSKDVKMWGDNGFKQNDAIRGVWNKIMNLVVGLSQKGIHVVLTLPADKVGDVNNPEYVPNMRGYGTVSYILGTCPTILRVSRMVTQEATEDSEEIVEHILVTSGLLSKSKSVKTDKKDQRGRDVMKPEHRSFSLGIAGIDSAKIPPYLPANLKLVLELIERKGDVK